LTSRVLAEITFDWPIQHFIAHPSRPDVIALLPANNVPLLVHLAPGRYHVPSSVYDSLGQEHLCEFLEQSAPHAPAAVRDDIKSAAVVSVSVLGTPGLVPEAAAAPSAAVASAATVGRTSNARRRPDGFAVAFSKRGDFILRGGPDGIIYVFSGSKMDRMTGGVQIVRTVKVPGGAAIRSLTFFRDKLLVNSWDRAMRLFDAESILEPIRQEAVGLLGAKSVFTEAVSRMQCRCACFSQDGDLVLGGMAGNEHRIHVWRASDGHLETTLQGPTEGIVDLLWHPVQPVIASIGSATGGIYIWAKNFTENWSAFAPDFTELEANEEYEEAEDEFDAKDPGDDARIRAERERAEESVVVDIETCDPTTDLDVFEGKVRCIAGDQVAIGFGDIEHPSFFRLPATPVPDSNFPYPVEDKRRTSNGRDTRDVAHAPDFPDRVHGPSGSRDGIQPPNAVKKIRRSKPPRPSSKRNASQPAGDHGSKKVRIPADNVVSKKATP
jgi:hypothetical protein